MHIGERIRGVLIEQGHSAVWLANKLPCERSNVYHIFKRSDISLHLLLKISKVLQHDFLQDISEYYKAHPNEIIVGE